MNIFREKYTPIHIFTGEKRSLKPTHCIRCGEELFAEKKGRTDDYWQQYCGACYAWIEVEKG